MLAYLGRYTHRVAISNQRLITLDETGVTFRCKDYRRTGAERYGTMTLGAGEFTHPFSRRALVGAAAGLGLAAGAAHAQPLNTVRAGNAKGSAADPGRRTAPWTRSTPTR